MPPACAIPPCVSCEGTSLEAENRRRHKWRDGDTEVEAENRRRHKWRDGETEVDDGGGEEVW